MPAEKINILIVEDESIVAMALAAGMEKQGYSIAGIADNAVEAMELYQEQHVDIVLMDINIMGDKDGVDTTIELLKIKQVPVIYLTAFTDESTVNRVKQTHPAAFLTKPYNMSNVGIAIELAINNFALSRETKLTSISASKETGEKNETGSNSNEILLQMENHIFIKQNYKFIKVALNEVQYIEADNNHIHIITSERKYTLRMSLQQFQDKLNYKKFIRIHRAFLVNMQAVQSFNESEVQVNNTDLPLSRTCREDFIKQFSL